MPGFEIKTPPKFSVGRLVNVIVRALPPKEAADLLTEYWIAADAVVDAIGPGSGYAASAWGTVSDCLWGASMSMDCYQRHIKRRGTF